MALLRNRGKQNKTGRKIIESMAKSKTVKRFESQLDATDWTLLEAVQQDARTSYAELGRRCGLSPPAAAERLRRLEDAGILRGYHATIDPAALGLGITVLIEIQVRRAEYPRFQKAARDLPSILECSHVSGWASFLLKAVAQDVEGIEILIGKLSQFGETRTSLVLSTVVSRRTWKRRGLSAN
jgi:Lrp/AsnC family transcriptional regulator, leucine-responsive regulatory protein